MSFQKIGSVVNKFLSQVGEGRFKTELTGIFAMTPEELKLYRLGIATQQQKKIFSYREVYIESVNSDKGKRVKKKNYSNIRAKLLKDTEGCNYLVPITAKVVDCQGHKFKVINVEGGYKYLKRIGGRRAKQMEYQAEELDRIVDQTYFSDPEFDNAIEQGKQDAKEV